MKELLPKVLYTLLSLIFIIPACLIGGFVIKTMWEWFICPLGVPSISLAHAIGIDVLVSFLIPTLWKGETVDKRELAKRLAIHSYINPWLFLGIAYVAKLWMV